jgi:hypothetical protein
MYHFYEVYDSFVSSFKKLMFGNGTSRLSLEATTFLDKRGSFEAMENYSVIRFTVLEKAPIYLPFYVPDKIFVIEVCRQYKFWANFFYERKKKQFISLPWKIGEITLKNASKIDEYAVQFDQYNLKMENEIKGFDPNQYFMNHMTSVGFSVSYANTYLFGEEEDDGKNPEAVPVGDLETVISTNEAHRQHGRVVNERSTRSQSTSQRSDTPKQNPQIVTQEQNKSLTENSGDGDDHDPPKRNLERPHKLTINSKRKRQTNQQEVDEVIPEDEYALEDMDLDVNIEDIEFLDEEQRIQESKEVAAELATQEPIFFEEESLTLHSALFDKDSKKLVFERVNSKGKKVQGKTHSEFNLSGVLPSRIAKIHRATGDALEVSVDEMEAENVMLKERVKELEYALMPPPIFASPIATIQPWKSSDRTPESSSKFKGNIKFSCCS